MAPEEIVRAEMAAWGRNDVDAVMCHFAENATLHAGPYAPVLGHDAIRKTVNGYFSRGTCVDHEILFIATVGDVVLMERIDHWIIDGKTLAIPHMGVCEVKGRKNQPPGVNTSLRPSTPNALQRIGRDMLTAQTLW